MLADDCAVFFAELHSSDISKIDADLREIRPIRHNMEKYLSGEFSMKEIDGITAYTDFLYTLQDKCLIHNDFYYDNFFLDENFRLKCVIDFANGGYYNYHFDLRKVISYEEGERDFFERIVKFYERITGRKIDLGIIRAIDVHNYISFLVYFAKNPDIKEEKIGVRNNWRKHVEHIKDKIRRYKIV
jgi:thiamine kinase-like enzyme